MADILINVLLDRSGSMAPVVEDVIGHYNNYIKELRELPYEVDVSLSIFDDQYENVYLNRNVNEVPVLDHSTYFVRGFTALLDAVGRFITSVDALEQKPSKVVFVINTDGLENASVEYRKHQIKEMITKRQDEFDWQFVFIGAGIDAFAEAGRIGINTNSTWSTTNDSAGYSLTFDTLNRTTYNYASGSTMIMDMNAAAQELEEEKNDESTRQGGSVTP